MGFYNGRLGSISDLKGTVGSPTNLGLPFVINPASVTLAVATGKEWYDKIAAHAGVDNSWQKMKAINKVGRTNTKTKLCKRADWSCLSQFSIDPGERLDVLGGSENWLYVRNMSGVVGYVPRTDITASKEDIPPKGESGSESKGESGSESKGKGGGMGALVPVGIAIALLNK